MSQLINLYQAPIRKVRQRVSAKSIALSNLVLLLALSSVAGVFGWQTYSKKTTLSLLTAEREQALRKQETLTGSLQALKQDDDASPTEPGNKEFYEKQKQKIQTVIYSLNFQHQEKIYAEILISLARQIIPGVRLTNVAVEEEGNYLRIEGESRKTGWVTSYLQALQREKVLQGKTFNVFQVTQQVQDDTGEPADSLAFVLATHQKETPETQEGAVENPADPLAAILSSLKTVAPAAEGKPKNE